MKRVLFVDDEAGPLDGLRRSMYRAQSKWTMAFVGSGELALAELERDPCDVIVADMRMPRMDGGELLAIVSQRWPQTIRIVLSGYAAEGQIVRLVPLAHRYLSKPCEPGTVEAVIERCLQLQKLLQDSRLRAVVGRVQQLPAIPRVYASLTQIMSKDDPTVTEVAAVVQRDSAVAAKVLHVVNSSFFRLARPITKIEHAVAHLGFGAIRSLALSAEVFRQWPGSGGLRGFEPERLQAHVQEIAAATCALAGRVKWIDDALLAGLLHDIGYWVLLQQCAGEMSRAVAMAEERAIPLHEAEFAVLGTTHAQVGAYLLGLWGLPYSILEAVAFHHDPLRVSSQDFDVLAALATAHVICDKTGPCSIEGSPSTSACIDGTYLASVRAPFDWEEAERRVAEAREQETDDG
ncbi:MAG: HDOD domain-containing protein [Steroidobacteraceae bacterium]